MSKVCVMYFAPVLVFRVVPHQFQEVSQFSPLFLSLVESSQQPPFLLLLQFVVYLSQSNVDCSNKI